MTASINGGASSFDDEAPYTTSVNIKVGFLDSKTNPTFKVHTQTVRFEEGPDLSQIQPILLEATYPNDVNISDLTVYYLLRDGNSTLFQVDSLSGDISLKNPLDFEEEQFYTITIQSSRMPTLDQGDDSEETKLTVSIEVLIFLFFFKLFA